MLLFDANPMALHRRNNHGLTPLGCARDKDNAEVVAFLEAQIELERQARELIQPDENGQLPIHHALRTQDVSLGAIKLMAAANPASLILLPIIKVSLLSIMHVSLFMPTLPRS